MEFTWIHHPSASYTLRLRQHAQAVATMCQAADRGQLRGQLLGPKWEVGHLPDGIVEKHAEDGEPICDYLDGYLFMVVYGYLWFCNIYSIQDNDDQPLALNGASLI